MEYKLSPDAANLLNTSRRKSLCNGAIMAVIKNSGAPPKKKDRIRRGSLSEPPPSRRASLVQRWFKHISDAADAYKSRTKNNHEIIDDPSTTTISNYPVSQSLERTPDKELPPATATVSEHTNVSNNNNNINNNNNNGSIDRSDGDADVVGGGRRKDRSAEPNNNLDHKIKDNKYKQQGGDADGDDEDDNDNGDDDDDDDEDESKQTKHRKREYSNNSNNTRTLTQQSSLVAPSEVHISCSPALTAEPVLTPNERLRRLDEALRSTLAEKQKVVCDMFRVPSEHFTAIADIAAQPEAPKEPSDIVLAAFAQVQSLTEILNEYIKVSTHHEISAVSTSLCDECYKGNHIQRSSSSNTSRGISQNNSTVAIPSINSLLENVSDALPHILSTPLPPTPIEQQVQPTIPSPPACTLDRMDSLNEDDDGYCEIDELRLPTVLDGAATTGSNVASSSSTATTTSHTNSSTPELKRQSTISADSIPEETEHEIHAELIAATLVTLAASQQPILDDAAAVLVNSSSDGGEINVSAVEIIDGVAIGVGIGFTAAGAATNESVENINYSIGGISASGQIETNDTCYDLLSQPNSSECCNLDNSGSMISSSTEQRTQINCLEGCGSNRLAHVTSLAPSVPCHLISNYVSALNLQISQLLPKLNERDIERENLRKENQHLRELLNSMHERERIANERDIPTHVLECKTSSSGSSSASTSHQNSTE